MAAAGYEYIPFEDLLGGQAKIHAGKFTICRQVRGHLSLGESLHNRRALLRVFPFLV